ncbi:Serine/threonine protein phosphatase PrpC [Thermomonospora echinospora]|uniref:Serine/threonine protein phosphatase PrpC n=1 Tax=Thermomonospora echinospora TaxID=1992 RepID=A0A1H5Z834_9ACTN|nr:protein phosphatase 2C domain-containing protein [Thermomonospora echinospora]SEG32200.1 Serine/threonine protein phosphatase PrpC [Thermomonospora echinospora]
MDIRYASEATPGRPNEDCVVAGDGWVVLLDGATQRPDVDSGCVHGPRWLVARLAGELARLLTAEAAAPLADLLAEAIGGARRAHADGCDLTNPDSPSTTAAVVRRRGERLDWLVLADSPVVIDLDGRIEVVLDDRTARLPSYTAEAVRRLRNAPGGFWVAGARPEAAYEAVTGSATLSDVRRLAVLSDGAARLVERFGLLDWRGLLDVLDREGPAELIRRTRLAELAETAAERAGRRGKRHDDATAALVRFR